MSWPQDLPRKYYEKYQPVPVKSAWFSVYRLPHDIYAITEPLHFQEVNSFLILGRDRALLLDTGMGIDNIKTLCQELYSGPIDVVNSHFHFDHITDDHRFNRVYSYNEPHALSMLRRGFSTEELAFQIKDDQFWGPPPASLNRAGYHIPAIDPIPVEEGAVFDLGGRQLTVLHTPGHSADSMMLWDRENRLLFTGDTFYLGALYAHFDSEFLGKSNFQDYKNTFERIKELEPQLDFIICSHNDMLVAPKYLSLAYEAFASIEQGAARPDGGDIGLHGHGQGKAVTPQYFFDGFSVITKEG